MVKLPIPDFRERQMGQVIVTLNITNHIDQILAERGFIPKQEVRSVTLTNILVDTGATLLYLPSSVITQLGLVQAGEASVETSAGIKTGRIFKDVDLCVEGRKDTFKCLELTEVSYALLGVIPMQALGLEPDLRNHKLRLLPMNPEQSYLTAL